jgi:AcrR family transcriptional regulator
MPTEIKILPNDGRTQRRVRNRERVVESLFGLVREGYCRPTADQVAERAGVGRRTVFRHFDDLESLFAELATQVREEARKGRMPIRLGIPLKERVRELVARRSRSFEDLAPFRRANTANLWRSSVLRTFETENNLELREDLRQAIPELLAAGPQVAAGVELLAAPETWDRFRDLQSLSFADAEAAIGDLILQLLGDG